MKERIDALTEITLAIARAAAERDAAFAETLESGLRGALLNRSVDPLVFDEAFGWLARFETETGKRDAAGKRRMS